MVNPKTYRFLVQIDHTAALTAESFRECHYFVGDKASIF